MKIMQCKILTAILICLFFSAAAHSSSAQTTDVLGWQDSRWGMTESEILEKFKGQVTKLTVSEKFVGAYVNYVISPYLIEKGKYTVRFQMHGETKKLQQVLVRLDKMASPFADETYFNQLDSLLTREYGTPRWTNDERKQNGVNLDRSWIFPTTTIELSYLWLKDAKGFNVLAITYFPTKKS